MSGITGVLFGSVSLRLAARAKGPLLVVRGGRPRGEGGEVLLGLEDTADADAAGYALDEAERRGTGLRVLHSSLHRRVTLELPSLIPATSPGQRRLARQEAAEDALPHFIIAELRELHPAVEVDVRTVLTGPAHASVEANREAADVVVIGARRVHGRTARRARTLDR